MTDHSRSNKNAHILKQKIKKEHTLPQYENFKTISSNNTKKRKISEAL